MADAVLEGLKAGIRRFQAEVYPAMRETYQVAASTPQQPKTLLITCADSRIDVERITSSGPGEIFTARNIGNLVPAYPEPLGGVGAVIEYAVEALKVKHIVVCGHSDCGAMKALLDPPALAALPTVGLWLTGAAAALRVAEAEAGPDEPREVLLRRLTEKNVLLQSARLLDYPAVAAAMDRGELTLSGWVYEIGTGEVRIADFGETTFHPVGTAAR